MSNFAIKHYLTGKNSHNAVKFNRTLDELETALRYTTAEFLDNTTDKMIAPLEFTRSQISALTVTTGGNYITVAGSVPGPGNRAMTAVAKLTPPNGSIFTKLTGYNYFSDITAGVSSALTLTLHRADTNENEDTLATLNGTLVHNTYTTDIQTSISNATVDNTIYTYYLKLVFLFSNPTPGPKAVDTVKLLGARVDYQLRP